MPSYLSLDAYSAQPKRGNILNWAPPKSGKTYSLASLAKMGLLPIWLMDWDFGAESFIRRLREMEARKEIPPLKPEDVRIYRYYPTGGSRIANQATPQKTHGREMFVQFMSDCNSMYDNIDPATNLWKPGLPYGTVPAVVCVDTMTELMGSILEYELMVSPDGAHELNAKGTDARNDYGRQMKKIVECIKSLRALPIVSIWNFHDKQSQNKLTQEIRNDPYVTGQLAGIIAGYFDVAIYGYCNDAGRYMWRGKPNGMIKSTGSRFKDLPGEVEQDYANII